jgi:hypothetical protein
MSQIKIDYSSTLFYMIFCKDTTIDDLYIGHTTNFVQRKQSHKQSCSNTKNTNYKCKLYNVIRDNGGWDNWKMQIIAFHECDDLMSAKKYEQQYFEEYKATLNSIEPLPKPKPKIIKEVIKKEKQILYCNVCNVHFGTTKLYEVHNKTKKHIKMVLNPEMTNGKTTAKNTDKFYCDKCDFKCSKKGDYNRHLLSRKHNISTDGNNDAIKKTPYVCEICNKEYKDRTGLWRHKKKCSIIQEDLTSKSSNNFHCEKCDYKCSRKSDYNKHLSTSKHTKGVASNVCNCGKIYKHRQGLSRHKKKCSIIQEEVTPKTNNIPTTDKEVLIKMLLENQDIMTKLIEVIQEDK